MEQPTESVDTLPEVEALQITCGNLTENRRFVSTSECEEIALVGVEVDLQEVLNTEVEIKEEEVELDDEIFLPADDTPDPIGNAIREDELNHRKKNRRKYDSSTETADEGFRQEEANSNKRKDEKLPAVKRKKNRNKPKFNGLVMPRFVPGMMIQRNKNYLCLECGHQFDSTFLFATHTKQLHVGTLKRYSYSCFYCPRKFRTNVALQRHLLIHSRLEPLRCPICRATFYSALGMANHVATHTTHEPQKEPETVRNIKNPIYSKIVRPLDNVCFVCGATKATEEDLIIHVKSHQGMLQCRACYEMLPCATELLDHVQTVHNNQAELTYYSCPLEHCDQSFLSAADMRKHSQDCVPSKQSATKRPPLPFSGTPMDCDICGLTYYELDHFVTHMRLHGALSRETTGPTHCKLCAFVAKCPGEQAIHLVKQHGYRDRLESLVDTYGKLNIVPPEESSGGRDGG